MAKGTVIDWSNVKNYEQKSKEEDRQTNTRNDKSHLGPFISHIESDVRKKSKR